jgi:hypothetical protein
MDQSQRDELRQLIAELKHPELEPRRRKEILEQRRASSQHQNWRVTCKKEPPKGAVEMRARLRKLQLARISTASMVTMALRTRFGLIQDQDKNWSM